MRVAVFARLVHLLAGAPRLIDRRAGPQVLEARADEGAALTRLDVLKFDDGVYVIVHDDGQAVAEIARIHASLENSCCRYERG